MQLKTGAIVNIAWPDTKVRKTNAPYDGPMTIVGLCKDGYYKVGHAALLLIDYRTTEVRYFDFGRYHTPYGYGRARDVESDPELRIDIKAELVDNRVVNLPQILLELQKNPSTHGDGKLYATITHDIDYDRSFNTAKLIQSTEATLYGPFQFFGTNCSRFVATIYKAGLNYGWKRWKINLSYLYFHTCLTNIITTHTHKNMYVVDYGTWQYVESKRSIYNTTAGIDGHHSEESVNVHSRQAIPEYAHCLAGVGGNTFFTVKRTSRSHLFRIRRYSEDGHLEIDDFYKLNTVGFDITRPYRIDYISTGIHVKIRQGDLVYKLTNMRYNQDAVKYPKTKTWRFKRYT